MNKDELTQKTDNTAGRERPVEHVVSLPPKKWEDCPNCPNQGWYPATVIKRNRYGEEYQDLEQEQCEFCYRNPNSVFNQTSR